MTFFICHNLAVLLFIKLYFSIFSRSLSHTHVSPGIATPITIISFFTLSTTTISGLLASIMWSHCMVKSHRILNFYFLIALSGSCSYQNLPLLNPSYSQNCRCSYIIMSPFVLLLGKFTTCTDYMGYSLISCTTHSTKGWLGSFVNIVLIVLDLVSMYRLFLGTTYKSFGASFQIIFSHPSPCFVLILVLHISSKFSMHSFCSPFIFSLFFISFLEFFTVNCFLVCYSSTCSDCN